jgi:hypothetical protein
MIRYSLMCGGAETPIGKAPATAAKGRGGKAAKSVAAIAAKPAARAVPKKPSGCGHAFESWFQNSAAFDSLAKAGQITCPACGSAHVEKSLMAPSVKTTKGRERAAERQPVQPESSTPSMEAPVSRALATLTPEQRAFIDTMRKVRDHVLSTSEDVGTKFVEEARKIHHEETEARSIHGQASIEEAKALADEGIDIFPLPALPDDRN